MDLSPAIRMLEEKIFQLEHAKKTLLELVKDGTPVPAVQPAAEAPPAKLHRNPGRKKQVRAAATTTDEKVCNKCKLPKPLSEFPTNHTCRGGHEGTCKPCKNARIKAHRAAQAAATTPDPEKTEDGKIICPLCNTHCSAEDKYKKHLYMVHDKEV